MTKNLIPTNQLVILEDEPRVLDLDLARWLGFTAARQIRELIARNIEELTMHGGLSCRATNPGKQGGRPGKAYYLNEGQALVICALSRTSKAAQVRKALIDVFMAYRAGKLVHVKEHRRKLPTKVEPDTFESNMAFINAFSNNRAALLELFAGTMTRLDRLERHTDVGQTR